MRDRRGRFQAADGGTLFLDEVGEIPLDLQSKLLRVLQEGQYERVGEEKTRAVDVRIIAATNRNLKEDVELKRFRQDLFYRLNVFPIQVAPLRERKEDIPLLARHFLGQIARRINRASSDFSSAQLIQLQEYQWPGNIRELQNMIERAVIISGSGPLQVDLPKQPNHQSPQRMDKHPGLMNDLLTDHEIKQIERENIVKALSKTKNKIYGDNGAASLLGLKPTTLTSKIKKYKITKPE